MDRVLESLCGSEQGPNDVMMWTLLRQGVIDADCHRHGRLARLSLDSFFILLSPTLHSHSLILSSTLSYLFT